MKHFLLTTLIVLACNVAVAQNTDETPAPNTRNSSGKFFDFDKADDEEEAEKPKLSFKQHLFTGGAVNANFFNGVTILGLNPYFGYSFGSTLDVALQTGYTYTGQRDIDGTKYRQNVLTTGGFARLFLLENIFLQGGYEKNFITEKAIYPNNGGTAKVKYNVGSFLVGGGYSTGRSKFEKAPYFFVSITFDVTADPLSPYTRILDDGTTQAFPIVTAGMHIPLFQGKRSNSSVQ
jgi:hypothetical protein